MSINNLSKVTTLNAGDLAPVFSGAAGSDVAVTLATLTEYLRTQLVPTNGYVTQYAAPQTGDTVQVAPPANGSSMYLLLTPTAALSACVVTLPQQASCLHGQEIRVVSTQAISSLTVQGNGAQVHGAPTSIGADGSFSIRYDAVFRAWYPGGGSQVSSGGSGGGATTFASLSDAATVNLTTVNTPLASALSGKQATLVSGTNLKTVNGASLLGSGDLTVAGGSALTVTDLSTATAAGSVSDTFGFPALDGSGNLVRASGAQLVGLVRTHYADLNATTAPVILTANTILDASTHQRRLLVAVNSITITAPSTFSNLGTNFECQIVAEAPVTLGSGITSLSTSLASGESARIFAYNNGSANICRALVSTSSGGLTPSATLTGVPTTGWQAGTAKALTGATCTLTNIITAYAVFWDGSAEVGSRQAFTSSTTLAALSFTPAAANSTSRIRVYSAATGGTMLAETATFTVAAAGLPLLAPTLGASVVSQNGLYKFVFVPRAAIGATIESTLVVARTNPTGTDAGTSTYAGMDSGASYSGNTFPTGSNPSDGVVDGTHGGFASIAGGFNTTATGTASTAAVQFGPYKGQNTGLYSGVFPGAYRWYNAANAALVASGTFYEIWTTSDGQTIAVGPFTKP